MIAKISLDKLLNLFPFSVIILITSIFKQNKIKTPKHLIFKGQNF